MFCLVRGGDRLKALRFNDLLSRWVGAGRACRGAVVRRVKAGLPSERRIVGLRLASTFFPLFAISLEIAAADAAESETRNQHTTFPVKTSHPQSVKMRPLTDEEMKTVLDKVRLSIPPLSSPIGSPKHQKLQAS